MGNESTIDLIEDGSQYLYTQESYKLGAEQINLSNHTVWFNSKDNNYIAFFSPENTSDNVIIVCKDNETMARMISAVNSSILLIESLLNKLTHNLKKVLTISKIMLDLIVYKEKSRACEK